MNRRIQLLGIGNAIVDILVRVTHEEFEALQLRKGTMQLVSPEEQSRLLHSISGSSAALVSGGSVGNSIIGFSQLGGKAGFMGTVADDRYGLHYRDELQSLGIEFSESVRVGDMSGTCLVFITPDGERTMCTSLGVAGLLDVNARSIDMVRNSAVLMYEGYSLVGGDQSIEAIQRWSAEAKAAGTKLALTLSDVFVIEIQRQRVERMLPDIDFLFANKAEALCLTGASNLEEAFDDLRARVSALCVTSGEEGVYVSASGEVFHQPAFRCKPVDLTGAGDMFAGAFLYGLNAGYSPQVSARGACYLASKVISFVGARLSGGTQEFWSEGTSSAPA